MNYIDFLKSKQQRKSFNGIDISVDKLNPMLFDWQKPVVQWALRKGRAALFEDCGLGKTIQQLEWAEQVHKYTGENVLIISPLAVARQTKSEGAKFGKDINVCRSQIDVKAGINITNYEIADKFDPNKFAGVVLDESSILKSYRGKTKMQLLKMWENTPYRLTCTATPSPNNHLELLNQAEFLGVMKSNEALSVWFINDSSCAGNYRLKKHAVKPFWEWVSTWAICMGKPSDIGFSDEGYELPELIEIDEVIQVDTVKTDFSDGGFLRDINTSATGYYHEKGLTADSRAKRCADIVQGTNQQVVIWCNTYDEADLLKKYIPDAVEVRGGDSSKKKEQATIDFAEGKIRILISKPSIFGYGMNFQNCNLCIFCGRNYSYEDYYQAVRRFYRFGQKKPVKVISVIGSTELKILEKVGIKKKIHSEMKTHMYSGLKQIQCAEIHGTEFKLNLDMPKIEVPSWLKGA